MSADLNQEDDRNPRAFGLFKAAYNVDEALDVLSIGRTSLYKLVDAGHLHPVKLGKKTLILADDLARFLIRLRQANGGGNVLGQSPNPKSRLKPAREPQLPDLGELGETR
jgi:excisionase family DNA binding protein